MLIEDKQIKFFNLFWFNIDWVEDTQDGSYNIMFYDQQFISITNRGEIWTPIA